jgi:hypothetical protein
MLKKKIWAISQKIVTKLSKIWVWDPGSEIREPEKTYSGSRGQKAGSGSATLQYERTKTKLTFSAMQASRGFLVSGQAQHGFSFLPSGPAPERESVFHLKPECPLYGCKKTFMTVFLS